MFSLYMIYQIYLIYIIELSEFAVLWFPRSGSPRVPWVPDRSCLRCHSLTLSLS